MLATADDTHLGGEDFDNHVIAHIIKQYKKKTGIYVLTNMCATDKLKHVVERAKHTLFRQQSTRIEIKSFKDSNDFVETLTCAKFKELNMDLFLKTVTTVTKPTPIRPIPTCLCPS